MRKSARLRAGDPTGGKKKGKEIPGKGGKHLKKKKGGKRDG